MSSPPAKRKCPDNTEVDIFHSSRTEVCKTVEDYKFNKKRVTKLAGNEGLLTTRECKAVAYYMHRDQRVQVFYIEVAAINSILFTTSW